MCKEQAVGVGAKVKGAGVVRRVGVEGQAKWEPLRRIDAPESLLFRLLLLTRFPREFFFVVFLLSAKP